MALFKGLLGKKESPPEWAVFFSLKEYKTFINLVHDYFQDQNAEIVIEDGSVLFQNDSCSWASVNECGLLNLAQLCRQRSRKHWKQIVFQHFESFRKAQENETEFEEKLKNFYAAYNLITVRLWPESYIDTVGEAQFIGRRDLDGVVTSLVFDLPSTIRQVRPKDAAHWGKPAQKLFEIGLSNVRKLPRPRISEIDLGGGMTATLFSGDSFFVATYALLLQYYPAHIGPYGALIGIPTRHSMLCYPIRSIEAIKAAHTLSLVTNGVYNEGPGAISPYLYWYHEDAFTIFPYEIIEKKLELRPPEALVSLLRGLNQDQKRDE
ncbi:MAG: hypothetical protein JXB30_00435 [Anaerolineae bacterium]|nr:hypothetical protein [Anaerolineae bacterium]